MFARKYSNNQNGLLGIFSRNETNETSESGLKFENALFSTQANIVLSLSALGLTFIFLY